VLSIALRDFGPAVVILTDENVYIKDTEIAYCNNVACLGAKL